jgi:hypothetical protein
LCVKKEKKGVPYMKPILPGRNEGHIKTGCSFPLITGVDPFRENRRRKSVIMEV